MIRYGLAVLVALSGSAQAAGPVCFTAADKPAFPVYEQGPPPADDSVAGYLYYPLTNAASAQADKLIASKSSVHGVYWMWANHGPRSTDNGAKGNITSGASGVQVRFSTNATANDCTLAQTASAVGRDASPFLKRSHLTTATGATADTNDVCILPPALPPGMPLLLDYEVADGRSAADGLAFLTRWTLMVHNHGRKAILYPDALDGPSQAQTHLPEVAAQAAKLFDTVTVMLWSKNAQHDIAKSFDVQTGIYATTPDKLAVAFELAGTTLADAKTVNDLLTAGKASSLNLWRNGAVQGGDCSTDVNKKIACVALGRCS